MNAKFSTPDVIRIIIYNFAKSQGKIFQAVSTTFHVDANSPKRNHHMDWVIQGDLD